jgi:hypothetical protein
MALLLCQEDSTCIWIQIKEEGQMAIVLHIPIDLFLLVNSPRVRAFCQCKHWWVLRTRNLADCMLAHAVTNAALAGYVIIFHQWQYWL